MPQRMLDACLIIKWSIRFDKDHVENTKQDVERSNNNYSLDDERSGWSQKTDRCTLTNVGISQAYQAWKPKNTRYH